MDKLECGPMPNVMAAESISAASGLTFAIGHVENILLLNRFFPIVDTCLSCEDIARVVRWCPDGDFWRLFPSCISASRVQHVSDLHLKFAVRPYHVCKYGRHPLSDG